MAALPVPQKRVPKAPLIIIFGATGTGKSQLAVDLAARFNGEIINSDAMQLYAGLPIVTNKITPEEQAGVPHHLLGCISLSSEPWRVGIWAREARRTIGEIRQRGRVPVVVGGTGYYLQCLLGGGAGLVDAGEGIGEEEMEERWPVLRETGEVMLQELRKVDPEMAERWHPCDVRKIRRSLVIWLTTGRRASEVYREQREALLSPKADADADGQLESGGDAAEALLFWVHAENLTLKARLDKRVDKMLQAGLLDEVKSLDNFSQAEEAAGHAVDKTRGIWVSIGWKEFEPYLDALKSGTATEAEAEAALKESIERTQSATRRYAKYQVRWIRHQILPVAAREGHELFLLDSSKLEAFEDDVSKKAIEITASWLKGKTLPDPTELSELAKGVFDARGES